LAIAEEEYFFENGVGIITEKLDKLNSGDFDKKDVIHNILLDSKEMLNNLAEPIA